jgi:transposase
MGAAYSEDLRRCIIKASEQGYQSVRELAKRFEVGKTFVNNLFYSIVKRNILLRRLF